MEYNMGINVNSEFSKLWNSDTNLKRNSSKLTNKVKKENQPSKPLKLSRKQKIIAKLQKCAEENISRIRTQGRKERKQNKTEYKDFEDVNRHCLQKYS